MRWLLPILLLPNLVFALDFRSVVSPKAILYDAPSSQAKKLYILNQLYPVEIMVDLGAWLKVRDSEGGLSWIEAKYLSKKRTLIVREPTEIKQSADAASTTLANVEKEVMLELVGNQTSSVWVEVRHPAGVKGYVANSAVWGL